MMMSRYWWVGLLALWILSDTAQALDVTEYTEAPLEFILNAQSSGPVLIALRTPSGALWLESADLHSLRLKVPKATPLIHEDREYYPLEAIPGIHLQLDDRQQRVNVGVPAAALESSSRLLAPNPAPPLTPAAPGAFLSYQFSAQHFSDASTAAGFGTLGVFGPWGVLTDSGVVRRDDGSTAAVRLDTTYTLDFPAILATANLGDTISNPGSWGEAVRFAGFHFGSNFGIRPDLITTPLLSMAGSAVVPSSVDILVNNQRVSSQSVPPGPFVINDIPPLSGTGQVSVVVRDALGREQILTRSFYSGPTLLASGLSQYSFDVGALRENYAISSNQYGPLVAEETYRRGISDELTLAEHAEVENGAAHAGGVDAIVRVGSLGILTMTAVGGGEAGRSGELVGIAVEHEASILSLSAKELVASSGFQQVGDDLPGGRFKEQTLGQMGINLQRAGSLSLAWIRQSYVGQPTQKTVSLSHNVTLGNYGALSLSVSRSYGSSASTVGFLTFTYFLGGRDTVNLSARGGGSGAPGAAPNEALATFSHSPPIGPGAGYRLSASTAGDYDADWRQQLSGGDLEFEASRNQGFAGQSALADGTLTFLGGSLYASRAVPGSFAVVNVAGLPDVGVYVENQLVAHTDDSGRAVVPNLLPYVANRISIDPTQLPLDTMIDARQAVVAPPFMSGVLLDFPIKRVQAGLFRLVSADDAPVPPGASVAFHGESFPVALDGLVYVTGYDRAQAGHALWPGHACRFHLAAPPPHDPLPDLGIIRCEPEATPR